MASSGPLGGGSLQGGGADATAPAVLESQGAPAEEPQGPQHSTSRWSQISQLPQLPRPISETFQVLRHECQEMSAVPGVWYWSLKEHARLRKEALDPNKLSEVPGTMRKWLRLVLGIDHTHNLRVHLKVHLVQDLLIICLGVLFGFVLFRVTYATKWNAADQKDVIYMVCYPGVMFLRLIKMVIHPLMFTSIATGVASIITSQKSQRGFRTAIVYVLGTTLSATALSLLLAAVLKPGSVAPSDYLLGKVSKSGASYVSLAAKDRASGLQQVMQALDHLVPDNIITAVAEGNMLGLCFFSVMFGIAACSLDNDQVLRLLENANQLLIGMLPYRSQPFAVFFLIAKIVATHAKDLLNILSALGLFTGCVLLALALHALVVLPCIYYAATRRNPYRWMKDMEAPLFVALCTSSSAATMPYTLHAVAVNWPKTSTARFVIPLATQLNMNGTAIYQAAVLMYIAQVTGHQLSPGQCAVALFATLMSAMSTAGIPGASLTTIVYILRACAPSEAGLEDRWIESIALVMPVDKILDMVRTAVNVWGDTIACAVVDRRQGGDSDDRGPEVVGYVRKDIKAHYADHGDEHSSQRAHCSEHGDEHPSQHAHEP